MLYLVPLALLPLLPASPQEPPGRPETEPALVTTPEGRITFHARDLPLVNAFANLRRLLGRSIVVAPDVDATFTGDLYDLEPDEVVAAICRATGLTAREEGKVLYIERAVPEHRLLPLPAGMGEEAVKLVQPLLSGSGAASVTRVGSRQLLLVRDLPANVGQVASLLAELAGDAGGAELATTKLASRAFRLGSMPADAATDLVRGLLGSAAHVQAVATGDGASLLVVRATPAEIERAAKLLDEAERALAGGVPTETLETLETRFFRLDHARAKDLLPLLQPLLGPNGQLIASVEAEQGITPSPENAGGDSFALPEILVATDTPARLDQLAEAIASLDQPPPQILIEATIIAADVTDIRQMGFQFSILEGIGFLDPTATSPHGATLDLTGGGVSFGDFTPGEIDAGLGQAQTDLFGSFEPGGLNIGYFTGRVGAFLRALDDLTDVEILATPKIITLNKQRGEVMLGRRDGFITSVTTQTITTQRIEYLETGTRLIYRPFIASDGLIRLEIHPEDSDGGLTEDGLPFKNTAELTTNVMVRDGETVVIGGLFRTRDIEDVKQVPYLGDVPLLGALFRGSVHTTIREEIIVMLTPHVLRSGDEEAAPLAEERTDPAFGLLSDTWLRTGQQLLAANQAASAWLLFSAAHGLESEAAEQLREQALRSMVDPSPTALVDGLIDPMHFQVPQR